MDLSIVIVSWNVKEKLRECLRSVEETIELPPPLNPPLGQGGKIGLEYEVFVVDNASKDGTVEMVEKEFPWVHVIANDFNAGFAKANNQAIRLSQGQYVLLLNPDMRVFLGTLEGMVKFMEEERNKKVGVAGCHLVSPTPPSHPPEPPLGQGGKTGAGEEANRFPLLLKEGLGVVLLLSPMSAGFLHSKISSR